MQNIFSKYLYIPLYFATLLAFFYARLGVMQLCKVVKVCVIWPATSKPRSAKLQYIRAFL